MPNEHEPNESPDAPADEPEKTGTEIEIIEGLYINGKVVTDFSPTAEILHDKNYFGQKLADDRLELEVIESLLLIERNRLTVSDAQGTHLDPEQLISLAATADPKVWMRYLVYRDLRQRGYIARIGFGNDIHFRVFTRGANPQTDIAKYFVYILEEESAIHLDTLDMITTQTLNSRKNLLLATVDRLGDITYYQLEQFNPPFNKKKETAL
jgi:tRNA-intron endonuclease, archaea type